MSSLRLANDSSSWMLDGATMNNWLAFSLSPQDQLPPSQTNSTLISAAATTTTAGDSSTGDVCFNIPQGHTVLTPLTTL